MNTPVKLLIVLLAIAPLSSMANERSFEVIFPGQDRETEATAQAYQGSWKQLVLVEGDWQESASINERMEAAGDDQWLHVQTSIPSDEMKVVSTRLVNRSDLFTTEVKQELLGFPDTQPRSMHITYANKQIKRKILMADGQEIEQMVHMPFDGYDGFILGLALSGLPLSDGKEYRLPSVMPNFMAGYWLHATVSDGGDVTLSDGSEQSIWFVDVEWWNINDGDIYPAGPDGTGGRYSIFKQPKSGQPAVYRYQTDTVDIVLK